MILVNEVIFMTIKILIAPHSLRIETKSYNNKRSSNKAFSLYCLFRLFTMFKNAMIIKKKNKVKVLKLDA